MRFSHDSRGINEPPREEAEEYSSLPDYAKARTIRLPSDYVRRPRLPSDDLKPEPFPDRAL